MGWKRIAAELLTVIFLLQRPAPIFPTSSGRSVLTEKVNLTLVRVEPQYYIVLIVTIYHSTEKVLNFTSYQFNTAGECTDDRQQFKQQIFNCSKQVVGNRTSYQKAGSLVTDIKRTPLEFGSLYS